MRSLITWLNNAIDRATNMSEDINNIIFKNEYPRARETVLAMQAPTPKQVWEKLREEKFHEVTCKRVATLFKKQVMSENLDDAQAAEAQKAKTDQKAKDSSFWKNLYGKFVGDEPKK